MKFATKAIHAGIEPDPATSAIMTPIYQTSTYVRKTPGEPQEYSYSRSQNPTRTALQRSLAALENGTTGFCFASGQAATDAILRLYRPGDEIIVSSDLYGGTYRIITKIYEPFGLVFRFADLTDTARLPGLMTKRTKLVWIETPTNPLLKIVDISAITAICRKKGVHVAVDNTFASPYLQNPLDLGADIVMHSVTKYLAGHSDVIMGAVIVNDDKLAESLAFIQNTAGAVPGPQDCFLVLRGIKTLHIRMQRHCENASAIARWLAQHPKVGQVFYPGLPAHPDHQLARIQMREFGGMLSFELANDSYDNAVQLMERLELFSLAESLGGVESLCAHPATMSHASIPREERLRIGVKDNLIRLSVGIEDADDLIADLNQAIG